MRRSPVQLLSVIVQVAFVEQIEPNFVQWSQMKLAHFPMRLGVDRSEPKMFRALCVAIIAGMAFLAINSLNLTNSYNNTAIQTALPNDLPIVAAADIQFTFQVTEVEVGA